MKNCNWSNCKNLVTHKITNKWGNDKVWYACDDHVPAKKTGTWESKWYKVERLIPLTNAYVQKEADRYFSV